MDHLQRQVMLTWWCRLATKLQQIIICLPEQSSHSLCDGLGDFDEPIDEPIISLLMSQCIEKQVLL